MDINRDLAESLIAAMRHALADDYLRVSEAADLLKVDHKTLRGMIDRGELPCAGIGRNLRVRRSDIDALFQPRAKRSSVRKTSDRSKTLTAVTRGKPPDAALQRFDEATRRLMQERAA